MDIVFTILSLVGFIALTAGTALFVAAEFSLTALERSTVDEAARGGDRRSRQVQHAHKTLSFQLSGAQLGITITTLITGYLAEPVLARFITPVTKAVGLSESAASTTSLILALVIATSFSMIFGELVPKNLAISKPMPTARATAGLQAGFSLIFRWAINGLNGTANWIVRRLGIEPAEELRSARSPQELGSLVRTSAQRGSIDKGTAMLVDRSGSCDAWASNPRKNCARRDHRRNSGPSCGRPRSAGPSTRARRCSSTVHCSSVTARQKS